MRSRDSQNRTGRIRASAWLLPAILLAGCTRTKVIIINQPAPTTTNPVTPVDPNKNTTTNPGARIAGGADATTGKVKITMADGTTREVDLKAITVSAGQPPTATANVDGSSVAVDPTALLDDVQANDAKYVGLVSKGLLVQAQLDAMRTARRAKATGGADAAGMVPVTLPDGTSKTVPVKDFVVTDKTATAAASVKITVHGKTYPVDVTALQADIKNTANQPKYDKLVADKLVEKAQLDRLAAAQPGAFGYAPECKEKGMTAFLGS